MELLTLGIVLLLLLALNAFFVLAEFAIVKVRPSRVTQLAAAGEKRAALVCTIQAHLNEYLSVCQVGITLASVALGMVGERTAEIIMGSESGNATRYLTAMGVSYFVIGTSPKNTSTSGKAHCGMGSRATAKAVACGGWQWTTLLMSARCL